MYVLYLSLCSLLSPPTSSTAVAVLDNKMINKFLVLIG